MKARDGWREMPSLFMTKDAASIGELKDDIRRYSKG